VLTFEDLDIDAMMYLYSLQVQLASLVDTLSLSYCKLAIRFVPLFDQEKPTVSYRPSRMLATS